jgi:ATP-dependent helicase HrpB
LNRHHHHQQFKFYFTFVIMKYPVLEVVEELKHKLAEHPVVILQAPPGAGKSTVLPLELMNESWLGDKKIVMLEPRRLAARSVAHRLASLKEEEPGESVGYRVRFETRIGPKTRIEVVTEGILTRMIQQDNALEDIGLLIFDEFHERSLHADLALALSLQVQQVLRTDLRILIMSATLDGERISTVLNGAPIVTSVGRQYPVSLRYQPESDSPIHVRITRIIHKAIRENEGDLLVFLPGAGEIARTEQLLQAENVDVLILALYGDLPLRKQQEAIMPDPQGRRKVVLATSIAETSLTIEGVTVVIDSGLARVPKFDPRSGLTRLDTLRVTKDAADQRAGRAGRLGPGVCYRLWSEGTQLHLVPQRTPEILEADLSTLILELGQWGIQNVNDLLWVTPPPPGSVAQAKELLEQLDAIDKKGITARGKEMLKLPTHPRIAHMLLEAVNEKDTQLITAATDVASLLEERDPLSKDSGADLSLRVDALRKWRKGERVNAEKNSLERIERLALSWRKILKVPADNSPVSEFSIGKLLAAAYPERLARQTAKNSERYRLANGRVVNLPSHDPLTRESWLAIAHVDAGQGEGKIFIAAPVDEKDLEHLATEKETVRWDKERGLIVGAIEKRIANLVLSSKPMSSISAEKRVAVLCEVVREEGLKAIGWEESQREWQQRVMSLRAWRTDEPWPDVSDDSLLSTVDSWLAPFLINASKRTDLQRLDLNSIVQTILPWELNSKLDSKAPARIEVPSGSWIKVNYHDDGRAPHMEVRLQEVFGLLETPAVNDGRNKIILHLLSPGFKPVQVTQDLKSFWQNTYHEVRSELQRRYPRHSWPEDPWTARAVRGAVKRRG